VEVWVEENEQHGEELERQYVARSRVAASAVLL